MCIKVKEESTAVYVHSDDDTVGETWNERKKQKNEYKSIKRSKSPTLYSMMFPMFNGFFFPLSSLPVLESLALSLCPSSLSLPSLVYPSLELLLTWPW